MLDTCLLCIWHELVPIIREARYAIDLLYMLLLFESYHLYRAIFIDCKPNNILDMQYMHCRYSHSKVKSFLYNPRPNWNTKLPFSEAPKTSLEFIWSQNYQLFRDIEAILQLDCAYA